MPVPFQEVVDIPQLAPRPRDGHKGTFGKVLIVAGSRGMTGAAILTASAALRSGAGLVRVASPSSSCNVIAAGNPCYTTIPLPEDGEGMLENSALDRILREAESNDVIALGPGLGRSNGVRHLVQQLVETVPLPMVVDADALYAFPSTPVGNGWPAVRLLTPHLGEYARLSEGKGSTEVNEVVSFAHALGVVLILKGQNTIVTDGERFFRNTSGNPGMATGGSGDVLTGILVALMGQGLDSFAAARLGVYVHGLAGDLAASALGEVSMIASDLINYLPAAFCRHGATTANGMA